METINTNFAKFQELYTFTGCSVDLKHLIDIDEFKMAPVAPSIESGLAYDGSLIQHILNVYHYAKALKGVYSGFKDIDNRSLVKVIVFHQLGKVGMFAPNPEEWQVKKQGKVYTFIERGYCLKTGDLSKMICGNAGISFTPEEYEAMSIMDKSAEEYESMNKYRTHLSTLIRMANDMAYMFARDKHNTTKE